mmetsp:Transcript_32902/g.52930  ORF Transcript_32902/g.52930 Transcript_32902/m.52930 type:complete len:311 (+) Transcript_32902:364-1296(+)
MVYHPDVLICWISVCIHALRCEACGQLVSPIFARQGVLHLGYTRNRRKCCWTVTRCPTRFSRRFRLPPSSPFNSSRPSGIHGYFAESFYISRSYAASAGGKRGRSSTGGHTSANGIETSVGEVVRASLRRLSHSGCGGVFLGCTVFAREPQCANVNSRSHRNGVRRGSSYRIVPLRQAHRQRKLTSRRVRHVSVRGLAAGVDHGVAHICCCYGDHHIHPWDVYGGSHYVDFDCDRSRNKYQGESPSDGNSGRYLGWHWIVLSSPWRNRRRFRERRRWLGFYFHHSLVRSVNWISLVSLHSLRGEEGSSCG